jgi:hypothetical protein
MRGSEVRTQLLPRSDVGVMAPWLVIAPPENPIIRVDLRLLDSVGICSDHDEGADAEELAGEHGESSPQTAQQDPRCELVLCCNGLEVGVYIADGREAVERLVAEALPLTRERFLESSADLVVASDTPDPAKFVIVGDDAVCRHDQFLRVGAVAFRLDVAEYAFHGANLPLPDGGLLQAAMAMLVVAASERGNAGVAALEHLQDAGSSGRSEAVTAGS